MRSDVRQGFRQFSAAFSRSSATSLVSPIASEISQTSKLLALASISQLLNERSFLELDSVSDLTSAGRAKAERELNNLKFSTAACFQSSAFLDFFLSTAISAGISDLGSVGLKPMV